MCETGRSDSRQMDEATHAAKPACTHALDCVLVLVDLVFPGRKRRLEAGPQKSARKVDGDLLGAIGRCGSFQNRQSFLTSKVRRAGRQPDRSRPVILIPTGHARKWDKFRLMQGSKIIISQIDRKMHF